MFNLYVIDTIMVFSALCGVIGALGERHRVPIPRWHLLMPGLFAMLSTILVLAFPVPSDLMDAQFWTVIVVCILAGGVRGTFIGMASDHYWNLVRLDNGVDALLASAAVLVVGIGQFAIEAATGAENGAESTFEFVMSVIAGYLLGRSIAAWLRARRLHHHDLKEV